MLLANLYDDFAFNEPSRADYYAMQIAAQVRLGNAKRGTKVSLASMRIAKDWKEPMTLAQATAAAKAAWAARLPGVKGL